MKNGKWKEAWYDSRQDIEGCLKIDTRFYKFKFMEKHI